MRHDEALRRQRKIAAETEKVEERGGDILFLDNQHLTRDCIGRELARRLPELNIVEHATARDLTKEDPHLAKFALVILYVHVNHMVFRADEADLDQHCISAQLSILEEIAPDVPRVLMSEAEVPEEILEAFRQRVRGYIPTALPIKQVAEAIRFVIAGGTFVPPSILSMHCQAIAASKELVGATICNGLAHFSPRQNEVLQMLWNGSSNKVIAYELRMSESTVKVHIRHIMKKLNVNNRTQVVLRTRPQRLEKDLSSHQFATASLPTAKAIAVFEETRSTTARAGSRALGPAKVASASHRS